MGSIRTCKAGGGACDHGSGLGTWLLSVQQGASLPSGFCLMTPGKQEWKNTFSLYFPGPVACPCSGKQWETNAGTGMVPPMARDHFQLHNWKWCCLVTRPSSICSKLQLRVDARVASNMVTLFLIMQPEMTYCNQEMLLWWISAPSKHNVDNSGLVQVR